MPKQKIVVDVREDIIQVFELNNKKILTVVNGLGVSTSENVLINGTKYYVDVVTIDPAANKKIVEIRKLL